MKKFKEAYKTEKFYFIAGIIFLITSISFRNGTPQIDPWLFLPGLLMFVIALLKNGIFQNIMLLFMFYFWGGAIVLNSEYNGFFGKDTIFIIMIAATIIFIFKIIKYVKNKIGQL